MVDPACRRPIDRVLCSLCQNLVFTKPAELDLDKIGFVDDWMEDPRSMISLHQSSRSDLELSANQGCHVCALIWTQLFVRTDLAYLEHDFDKKGRAAHVVLHMNWTIHWTADNVNNLLGAEPINLRYGCRHAHLWTGSPVTGTHPSNPMSSRAHRANRDTDDLSNFINRGFALSSIEASQSSIRKPLDNHTGSVHNLDLANIWLRDCLKTHDACYRGNIPDVTPSLPTRIIDLLDPEKPRIRETYGEQAEYLTLSYCWGQGKRLLSIRDSGRYEQYCKRIRIDESMPKTFKEALQVTEALGYRYIWIDALCIIQDDPNDVQQEMARMGEIYRRSTLTISAANGPDTDSGLFAERDARSCKPRNVFVTMKEGKEVLAGIVSLEVPYKERHSPLSERGWVLQEELLSRRSLVFTHQQVEWRCTTKTLSEKIPSREPQAYIDPDKGHAMRGNEFDPTRCLVRRPDIFKQAVWTQPDVRDNPFAVWYRIVKMFSRRALTVRSDKLLAVAGLASLVQQSLGGTYGAGLWKEDLQTGLGWYVTKRQTGPNVPDKHYGRSREYIAPSWSWASIHGSWIMYCTFEQNSDLQLEESIQVVDWEISQPPGAIIPFGQVASARLTVRGRLRNALLVPCFDSWDHDSPNRRHSGALWPAYAVDPLTSTTIGDVALDSVDDHGDLIDRFATASEALPYHGTWSISAKDTNHSLWYFARARPVVCLLYLVVDKYGHRSIVALVLTLHNVEKREYQRIGMLFINSNDMFATDIFFSKALGQYIPPQHYETINIV
jgi:hypothetical protein